MQEIARGRSPRRASPAVARSPRMPASSSSSAIFGREFGAEPRREPQRLLGHAVLAQHRQRRDVLGDQLGLERDRARVEGIEQRHVAHRARARRRSA